ncbi:MAG: GNAT family N-acetyltransferase [Rhodopseudomonas sp.]|uniref:GNAT family N-acetyltransferase n=1 Tax=Rhodopseudomonas sp. TaxID=1078 RepID=UPI00185D684F|nr:GNAT family N-acetyltransferase [Rhodopseudomonas sp.]NVN87737.1 GNAT family N-acetyltransferase [Rhodopseudomonas sp.]
MTNAFTISDLRQRPEFFDAVSDRIWRAWWQPRGYPASSISHRLRDNINPAPIPFALVAHDEDKFLGTASAIAHDLAERPQFTPWVAAVWVDPAHRGLRVGAALVDRAAGDCFALGMTRVYLCARPARSGFYGRLGWTAIEHGVGTDDLTVWSKAAAAAV